MAPVDAIRVDGLKQFSKSLKQVDSDLPKALRKAANEAANVVITHAERRVPTRSGRARRSLRASSTRTAARVSGGSKRVPYYGFLDFGGRVGRNGSIRRPFRKRGRYIFRAYDDHSGEVTYAYHRALVEVANRAGLEVDNG